MLDDKQIRAARALLNWTQETLADASGIARSTIKNLENGTTHARAETSQTLQATLEAAGVEFLPGSGVRMRDRTVQVHEGRGCTQKVLNHAYETLKEKGGEILIAHLDEKLAATDLSADFVENQLKRLKAANITERLLICEGDAHLVGPWHTYRAVPKDYFVATPMFIYGDYMALVSWNPSRAIIVHDPRFAEGARRLFNFVWDRALTPTIPQEAPR